MCGSARESHNLFHPLGRRYFFGNVRRAFMYVIPDTFGRYWCRVVGHKIKTSEYMDPICLRCSTIQKEATDA